MADKLRSSVADLRTYLCQRSERNEDLAVGYFRSLYPTTFSRQSDAFGSDGYVPGHFVLELKGAGDDWLQALFQALAYQNKGARFSLIVVACSEFLAIWRVDSLPANMRDDVLIDQYEKAPNKIGKDLARKYKDRRQAILKLALWHKAELTTPIFLSNKTSFENAIKNFESTLREAKRVRQAITLKNFVNKLGEMKEFFDPKQPIKTVRAFYSMIYGPWDEASVVNLSPRFDDQVTVAGVTVTDLVPKKRLAFKDFVESHLIYLREDENQDDFFSRFDEAIDKVDSDFRRKHGIYFTSLHLSKLAMWFVKDQFIKQGMPDLGKNYLVIDPACGSGNLVTNWKTPLELRHKVVSELEPELLYAVENRMKGDMWHNGKYTVVPKTSENRGLNFLDCSAKEYIDTLKSYLSEKKIRPDKPLAFLCNPPYRSDDDQAAAPITYQVHDSILQVTGLDASAERYTCFLAQMKLICAEAEESGFPGDSVLLLFTKGAWLNQRTVLEQIRREMLGVYEFGGGILVNSKEFFNVKVQFPVTFTIWFYKGTEAGLNPDRPVSLYDLSWIKRSNLTSISWQDQKAVEDSCAAIFSDPLTQKVALGVARDKMQQWSQQKMFDFKRDRRRGNPKKGIAGEPLNCPTSGGLPAGSRQRENKKTYGESLGSVIGFMDDLTPCRVNKGQTGIPWFRLNPLFMDVNRNRLFSGPSDNRAYSAADADQAKKVFVWYAMARTFFSCKYPLWADNSEMWPITGTARQMEEAVEFSLAIAYAENECISMIYPSGNPVADSPEIRVPNPMTPLVADSFWNRVLIPMLKGVKNNSPVNKLITAVDDLFDTWKKLLKGKAEIDVDFTRPYLIDQHKLMLDAGITQIKFFAEETQNEVLLEKCRAVSVLLKATKEQFHQFLTSETGLNYFGEPKQLSSTTAPTEFEIKTKFDSVLLKRLALAGLIVRELKGDKNLGRTKLAKIFYLADAKLGLNLDTAYAREAAGPLDQRALYHKQVGVEPLGQRHGYFEPITADKGIKYLPGPNLENLSDSARTIFGQDYDRILSIIMAMKSFTTENAEIVATLYACWSDLILDHKRINDKLIIEEFLNKWHERKARFQKSRLEHWLAWMKENDFVPTLPRKRTAVLMRAQ